MFIANTYRGPLWKSPLGSLNAQKALAAPSFSRYATALSSRSLACSAPGLSAASEEPATATAIMKIAAACGKNTRSFIGGPLQARKPVLARIEPSAPSATKRHGSTDEQSVGID